MSEEITFQDISIAEAITEKQLKSKAYQKAYQLKYREKMADQKKEKAEQKQQKKELRAQKMIEDMLKEPEREQCPSCGSNFLSSNKQVHLNTRKHKTSIEMEKLRNKLKEDTPDNLNVIVN
jgi:hypothetical protein